MAKIHPIKVTILAFIIWALLFFSAPITINITINYLSYIFITCCILLFIIGFFLYTPKRDNIYIPKSPQHLYRLFIIVVILAIIGLCLKVLDRFFIRGLTLESNYFSNREVMEHGSGNTIAILSAILNPFGFIPLFLYWKYNLKVKRAFRWLIFLLFFGQLFDAFLLGSRSQIFVVFIFFGLLALYFRKFVFSFKRIFLVIVSVVTFIILMNYIFLERTKTFAGNQAYNVILNQSNYNYTMTSSETFKTNFSKQDKTLKSISFIYITTIQYFTHGMIEFSYLYNNFNKNHSYGSYTFSVYARFVDKLLGVEHDSKHLQQLAPRSGVYTTFFGPIFIDFGWFSLVVMFFFGRVIRSIYEKSKLGSDYALLTYFFCFIILLFSPVFNFINGAGGIFTLSSFILFHFISKSFYRREKVQELAGYTHNIID